jgi:hypothetical protein
MKIYGIINNDNTLIDVSKTLRGCKRYATMNGYNKIGYRIEYYAFISHEKKNGKWVEVE